MNVIPFNADNADNADVVNGKPSHHWLQKHHPDSLHRTNFDEMVHVTKFEFVKELLDEAKRKGYKVFRSDPGVSWSEEWLRKRDKDLYGVFLSKEVRWVVKGVVGTSELMYAPSWHKKYGMVELWNVV